MAKLALLIFAAFCVTGFQANSNLVRPADPESETINVRPLPAEVFPEVIAPEIQVEVEEPDATEIIRPLPVEINPEVVAPQLEIEEPEATEIIRPLPVEVNPEIAVPELEVEEPDATEIIRPLPVEVNPVEPESEVCLTEEDLPEVIEVPEIEVVVPEIPQVKPQPIVPEIPEIEVIAPEAPETEACAESETAGLVRPLPVEENSGAVAPEIEVVSSDSLLRPLYRFFGF